MRKPDRLDEFYWELLAVHKTYYPDLREGQFLYNFLSWINRVKERDPFYLEHAQMMDILHEYTEYLKINRYGI